MSIESAFELVGFCGATTAVAYYLRGVRHTFPTNAGLALGILLCVSIVKYSINAIEWSGLFDTINLDYLEDYLDNIWPFTWFLFFFTSMMDTAARRLRHSEERYRQLVETNPDAVFCHRAGMIIIANPAAVELFGASSSEELIGRDFYSMVHADDVERLKSRREHIVQTRLSVPLTRAKFIQIDGRVIDVEVAGSLVAMDRGPMVQTVARDITARRKAEEALADSERRLSDIIEFLPDPTWVIDLDGRVVAWNKAVERMTGVKKKAILGKGGYAHAIPFYGEPRPTLIDLVLQRDRQWETNYLSFEEEDGLLLVGESFHPKMGEEGRFLSATAAKLYDAQGDVVGAVESLRDITAAKLAERDRERLIVDLQGALAEVRTLSGLLPICAKCKNIRDDRGYWNQIESYITKHSKAEFSHSICPDCAKVLYPDLHMQLK